MSGDDNDPEALAAAVDIQDLIQRSNDMADLLARVAQREEHENPSLAARAAQGAVRALTESVNGVLLARQIDQIKKDVKVLMDQRQDPRHLKVQYGDDNVIGTDKDGNEVKRPSWARPPKHEDTSNEKSGNTDESKGGGE